MRGKHDPALERVVDERVIGYQVPLADGGFVADQKTIGITCHVVIRNSAARNSNQVNGAAAVSGFVHLVDGLSRTTGSGAGKVQARVGIVVDHTVIANCDV